MMFMMSPEKHALFIDENNRLAQLFAVYTGVADFLMRWGPLVADDRPTGLDDYIMRQTANQRALVSLLRKTADELPLHFRNCKVAAMRLSDDLAVNVGMKPTASSSPAVGLRPALEIRGATRMVIEEN